MFARFLYRNAPELCLLCAPDTTPHTSATLSAICAGTFRNLSNHLHQNSPKVCLLSAIMPSNFPPTLVAICTGTLGTSSTIRNPPKLRFLSALEPSAISSAIYTRTLCNLVYYLRCNPSEPHQPSAPEPSGTSSAICTKTLCGISSSPEPSGTLRAICTGTVRRNPPEPHQPSYRNRPEPCLASALEPSGTLFTVCTASLRNLISNLHHNLPEPHQQSAP